jgi:hypothetical protein
VSIVGGLLAELYKLRENPGAAARRRAFAIHAYVGSNGGGKSLAMVHDTLPTLRRGLGALSTVRLLDYDEPRSCGGQADDDPELWLRVDDPELRRSICDDPANHERFGIVHQAAHPGYTPLRDFSQFLTWECGDILLDEVTGVASSRESHSMPAPVVNLLMQLRRREVQLRWTAPNWNRADKVIREVSQAVTSCVGSRPVQRRSDDDRLWRDRRLFRWLTFDAYDFDEFSTHKRDESRPMVRQWFWRPGSITERAFDTFDAVIQLGHVDESGRCVHCSGRRQARACTCPDYRAERAAARQGASA